jgi:hypothetical protein
MLAGTTKADYHYVMTTAAKEVVELMKRLPEEKAREIVDFARFLTQQAGDAAWEEIIENPRARPKLDAFVAEAMHEEPSEPLDPGKL